ncbi:uncharacterized protein LOC135114412 [Scylla paramamosain]|uniref:uncharacterized protein LOC135114412 n=1 Tax=Scylla paramamosain TaxID=85552 RepID=UPI00308287D8
MTRNCEEAYHVDEIEMLREARLITRRSDFRVMIMRLQRPSRIQHHPEPSPPQRRLLPASRLLSRVWMLDGGTGKHKETLNSSIYIYQKGVVSRKYDSGPGGGGPGSSGGSEGSGREMKHVHHVDSKVRGVHYCKECLWPPQN